MQKQFNFDTDTLTPEQIEHLKYHSIYKLEVFKIMLGFQREDDSKCEECEQIASALKL